MGARGAGWGACRGDVGVIVAVVSAEVADPALRRLVRAGHRASGGSGGPLAAAIGGPMRGAESRAAALAFSFWEKPGLEGGNANLSPFLVRLVKVF